VSGSAFSLLFGMFYLADFLFWCAVFIGHRVLHRPLTKELMQGRICSSPMQRMMGVDAKGDANAPVAASLVLQQLHDQVPQDHFTLRWLLGRLHKQAFGIIILILAVIAVAPGASIVAGALLFIPAIEMILGRPSPTFPRKVFDYPLPTHRLAALVQRAIPLLRRLERVIYPRWLTPHDATKRVVGLVVAILSASLVFIPIPLSNIVPAFVIVLIAIAYVEDDGLLLSIGMLAAAILLTVEGAAILAMVRGAKWMVGWYSVSLFARLGVSGAVA
jgi:hypothetical protein